MNKQSKTAVTTNTSAPKPSADPIQGEGGQRVPESETASGEAGSLSPVAGSDTVSTVIADHPMKGLGSRKGGFLSSAARNVSQEAAEKMSLLGKVRQGFAMAADLEREGGDKAKEATKAADENAVVLYQGRVKGLFTAEEVSALLGDTFGYKPTKDGSPGKTPAGLGEAVRKRVVRAVKAAEFVANPDASEDRFFEDLDPDKVEDILHSMEEGRSIWTVYEDLADLRKENTVRIDKAFDPKAIAGIVGKLAEPGAVKTLAASPALQAAYGELFRMLQIIDETVEEESEAA